MFKAKSWTLYLLSIITVIFLGGFFFYPLLTILVRSFCNLDNLALLFTNIKNCHFDAITSIFKNTYYHQRLWFTLYQACLSTLFTLLFALPSAFCFAFFDFKGKRLLRALFTIPFVIPTVVTGMGFLALLGPKGLLAWDLRNSLIIILLAHIFYNYILVVRIVSAYLENIASELLEAAAVLGASAKQSFLRVILPLSIPAILASASLVFIFCFTSFGVILILAPEARFATLELEIYRLGAKSLQLDKAATLVLLQILIVGIVTGFYTFLQKYLAVEVERTPNLKNAKGIWGLFVGVNILIAMSLTLTPLITLGLKAFWIEGKLGLRNFSYLLKETNSIGFIGLGPALFNSLRFATLATAFSTLIGFAFAYSIVRAKWHWLDNLSLLPLITSSVTLGLGYLLAFPELTSSIWGIVLAHSLLAFPFVVRSLLPVMRALPEQLLEAAKILGANPLKIIFQIELPLLIPAFIAAASFAFTVSLGEFGASLVLLRPEYATLPVAIFDRLSKPGASNLWFCPCPGSYSNGTNYFNNFAFRTAWEI